MSDSFPYTLGCGHTIMVPNGGAAKCEPCAALTVYVRQQIARSEAATEESPDTLSSLQVSGNPVVPQYARNEFDAQLANRDQRIRDLRVEATNWRLRALAAEAREQALHKRLDEAAS